MSAVVVASVAALLAGCSSGKSAGSSKSGGLKDNPAAVSHYVGGTFADLKSITPLCPKKSVTVAYADGSENPFRKASLAEFQDEASKCKNIKTIYTNAQGDTSKAISDIKGLTARGVDAIIIFADAGKALLPAVQAATKAGVIVVPFAATIGGVPGTDYLTSVGEAINNKTTFQFGELYGNWMVKALHGKGNVVKLGGPAGNAFSASVAAGAKSVFAKTPGIKELEYNVTTNWDPAECQKVMASLLTKYPKIDGIVSDYGACTASALRAFTAANRPLPPSTGDDENVFACSWTDRTAAQSGYQIAIGESRPWRSRLALRRALAGVERVKWSEPTDIAPKLVADSIAGGSLAPDCRKDLPPDAFTKSSMLTDAQIKKVYGG